MPKKIKLRVYDTYRISAKYFEKSDPRSKRYSGMVYGGLSDSDKKGEPSYHLSDKAVQNEMVRRANKVAYIDGGKTTTTRSIPLPISIKYKIYQK